jgi:hypothetical protein
VIDQTIDEFTAAGQIDFGILDERLQETVIRRTASDAASCEAVLHANPSLLRWDDLDESTIVDNRAVVQNQYSLSACGKRLWRIYHSVLECSPTSLDETVDADAMLASFLSLDRFRLIRT